MNQYDLFRVRMFFKNGESLNKVMSLHEFEVVYGNELREIYYIRLELVKENHS